MALLAAMSDIFGLERAWDKVRDKMTDSQIREFYRFIADLWPTDTDYREILPVPDSSLRALYLGENEPDLMVENVFRFCLYADQIVLVNPFENPNLLADKYNPILHPGEWRLQTIRLVFQLSLLAPWIEAGLVVLIPDPGEFNSELRVKMWNLALARLKGWKPSDEDVENSAGWRRTADSLLLAPRSYLERMAREQTPNISDEELKKFLTYIEQMRASNPFLPNNVTLDKMPGQMMVTRTGANLEMGTFICEAIGAFPYTNLKLRWQEILGAMDTLGATAEQWSPLTSAFQQLSFKFLENVDSKFACSLRQDGRLESFRSFLRKMWNDIGGEADLSKSETLARDFRDELTEEYKRAQAEWEAIDRDLLKFAVPTLGAASCYGLRCVFTGDFDGRDGCRWDWRDCTGGDEETRIPQENPDVGVH